MTDKEKEINELHKLIEENQNLIYKNKSLIRKLRILEDEVLSERIKNAKGKCYKRMNSVSDPTYYYVHDVTDEFTATVSSFGVMYLNEEKPILISIQYNRSDSFSVLDENSIEITKEEFLEAYDELIVPDINAFVNLMNDLQDNKNKLINIFK
ncbi:hypothetical protein K9M42_03435 [Patescibacteria group bacterium]|nr:hypothetical protein [Patescibacteria group bacterium]